MATIQGTVNTALGAAAGVAGMAKRGESIIARQEFQKMGNYLRNPNGTFKSYDSGKLKEAQAALAAERAAKASMWKKISASLNNVMTNTENLLINREGK